MVRNLSKLKAAGWALYPRENNKLGRQSRRDKYIDPTVAMSKKRFLETEEAEIPKKKPKFHGTDSFEKCAIFSFRELHM